MATATEHRVGRARANVLAWRGDAPSSGRRQRGRIVAGVILLLVSGWLAAAVYLSVGSREEVVVVAEPVEKFQELTEDDFRVARVAADPDVGLVPAGDIDELVGRVTTTALVEGALLHEDQLLDDGDRVVARNEGVVGAVLGAGDAPVNLTAGMDVEVIVRPDPNDEAGTARTLRGWVLEVNEVDTPGMPSQRVSMVVPADSVASVSTAASDERVSVAVLGTP